MIRLLDRAAITVIVLAFLGIAVVTVGQTALWFWFLWRIVYGQ